MKLLHLIGIHSWQLARRNDTFKGTLWACNCGKTKFVEDIKDAAA